MHFRILIKMITTSCFLSGLECTKFVFCRGSAPDLAGGTYSALQIPSWFKGPTSKRKGGEGNERGGKGMRRREGEERK